MRCRSGKVAVALMVGALCFGGLDVRATLRARGLVAVWLAAHPDATVAEVVAEPLVGRLRLSGVSLRGAGTDPWRVTIGTLRLPSSGLAIPTPVDAAVAAPAVSPSPRASAATGTVSAENVVIVGGASTWRIKRIDLTGTALTSADLAALFDTNDPASVETRLRRLSASAIVMPEITRDDRTPGTERHATLTQVLLAGVTAGKVAAGSASGGSLAIKDGGNAVNGTVGTIEVTGLDLGQVAHVLATTRTSDAEAALPLYDAATANTLTITNATKHAVLTIRSIRQATVKARALKTDLAGVNADPGPNGESRSAALFDDVAHSLSIGKLDLDDLASHSEAPDATVDFGVLRVSATRFGDGKLGGADLRSFHFEGTKEGKFALDTMVVGAVTLPDAAGGLRPRVPPVGTIDAAGIDVDLLSQASERDADGAPAETTRVKFKVGHVVVASNGASDPFPTSSSTTIENVSFDASEGDGSGLPLHAMGYRHVSLSGTGESTYDAATQDLTIKKLRVTGTDMGVVDLSLALGHVGDGLLSPDPETAQSAAVAIVAKSIDLKLANAGLFERAMAWKAKKDGLTIEQEQAAGIDLFTNGVPSLVNDNPKIKALGAAVAGFIADPKTLDVSVASPGGIGLAAMGMLATPDVLIDALDIKASSHP